MNEKVKEFLDVAKTQQRLQLKKERDKLLISLGLYKEDETSHDYSDSDNYIHKWDEKNQQWYKATVTPIEVTDEEYEEILKYAHVKEDTEDTPDNMNADNFLSITNGIMLFLSCVACFILIFASINMEDYTYAIIGIAILPLCVLSYALVKVFVNISRNIKEIDDKLKKLEKANNKIHQL